MVIDMKNILLVLDMVNKIKQVGNQLKATQTQPKKLLLLIHQ